MAFTDAVRGLIDPPPPTHFEDLIQAAYTGPQSGTRISFRYREVLSKNINRRLGMNRYLGVDGVEYQDNGNDDWKYTIEAFFASTTHPTDAREFADLLCEPAPVGIPGLLEHPRDKVKEVVVASVRLIDDPNKNANQTIVRVEFRDQLTLPADKRDRPEIAVQAALDGFNDAAAEEFGLSSVLDTITEKTAAAREIVSNVNVITETMGEVLGASAQVLADFNAIKTDVLNNVDTLLNAPGTLARSLTRLAQAVLDVPGDFFGKSDALEQLYKATLSLETTRPGMTSLDEAPANDRTKNAANIRGLIAGAAGAGMLVNVVQNTDGFLTKQAAYEAASDALSSVKSITEALEKPQQAFGTVALQRKYTTPATLLEFKKLKRICYAATQQLTARLIATRIITLPKDASVLQVCAAEYGNVSDDTVWSLIDTNNLSLEEIIVIPAGRQLFV